MINLALPEQEMNGHKVTFEAVWAEAAAHLEPALEFAGGTHTLEHVRTAIEDGEAQLWPMGEDGALVSEVIETPTGLRACRLWLAGGNMAALLMAEKVVSEWAQEQGCKVMEIIGRQGWQRVLPEYHKAAIVLRKRIA